MPEKQKPAGLFITGNQLNTTTLDMEFANIVLANTASNGTATWESWTAGKYSMEHDIYVNNRKISTVAANTFECFR